MSGERPAHVAHAYREDDARERAVIAWAAGALEQGGGALLVCEPTNATIVRWGLAKRGLDVGRIEREGRLLVVDAQGLMSRFVKAGEPDGAWFERLARALVGSVRQACGPGVEIRAWGEMVNILWHQGHAAGARRLERSWDGLIAAEGIRLLCSYDMRGLDNERSAALLEDAAATHTHMLSEDGEIEANA